MLASRWLRCCRVSAVTSTCAPSLGSSRQCRPLASKTPVRRRSHFCKLTMNPSDRVDFTFGSVDSSYLCVLRCVTSRATQSASLPSSTPTWQQLVRLLISGTQTGSEERISFEVSCQADSGQVAGDELRAFDYLRNSSPLRRLWAERYHPAFQKDRIESVSPFVGEETLSDVLKPSSGQSRHVPPLRDDNDSADCFPEDAEELPAFVQALGKLGLALNACIRLSISPEGDKSTSSVAGDETLSLVELCEWMSEVQAVLMYVGRERLRYLIPLAFSSAAGWKAAPSSTTDESAQAITTASPTAAHELAEKKMCRTGHENSPAGAFLTKEDEFNRSEESESALFLNTRREMQLRSHRQGQPSLRLLKRSREERLQHKAPPLPTEDLLRVVVLVEAARTILEVAQPPPLVSSVRAELYTILLSVVGASEQLSSSALASLTTCLAQCVDSYTARQQLLPLTVRTAKQTEQYSAGICSAHLGMKTSCTPFREAPLCLFYRPVCEDRNTSNELPIVRASLLEDAEASQLTQHRGGLNQMLKPTEVLQQLSVLANVTQHRLAHTLRAFEKENFFQDDSSLPADSNLTAESTPSASGARRPSTKPLAQQERLQEGMLGFLSLQERKARDAMEAAALAKLQKKGRISGTQGSTACTARPRRTIAVIQADAKQKAAEEQLTEEGGATITEVERTSSPSTTKDAPSSSSYSSTTTACYVTLTDVAEICSALAAMGYRGGGTASSADEPLWKLVADFACVDIGAVAQAGDAALCEERDLHEARCADYSCPNSAPEDCEEQKDSKEAVVEQLMKDVRDIVFALDRVGFTRGYDQVMSRLVQCAFLPAPIAAPSAAARAMKNVNGKSLEDSG